MLGRDMREKAKETSSIIVNRIVIEIIIIKLKNKTQFFKVFFFLMCIGGLPACKSVYHMYAVPTDARRGSQIS